MPGLRAMLLMSAMAAALTASLSVSLVPFMRDMPCSIPGLCGTPGPYQVAVPRNSSSCDWGILQLRPPATHEAAFACRVSPHDAIKAACTQAMLVRVEHGVVKLMPLVRGGSEFNLGAFGVGMVRVDCKDVNASGLFHPGSATSASVMFYDDYENGRPLPNLNRTGADQISLMPAPHGRYFQPCMLNFTVVQGCVLGVQAPLKPLAACPAGYHLKPGRFGVSYCALCPAGTASTAGGRSHCKPCPRGTYSSTPGSAECLRPTGNSYTEASDRTSYVECDSRKWYTDGRSPCKACPDGSYGSGGRCERCIKWQTCCTVGWGKDCPRCPADAPATEAYSSIFALEEASPSTCLSSKHAFCLPRFIVRLDHTCELELDGIYGPQITQPETEYNDACGWMLTRRVPARTRTITIAELDYEYAMSKLVLNASLGPGPSLALTWRPLVMPVEYKLFSDASFTASSPHISIHIPATNCTLRYRALTAPAADLLGAAPRPSNATSCPAGHFLETATDTPPGPCLPCPPGTYSTSPSSSHRCTPCPAGTHAPRLGSTDCIECPAGSVSQPGAALCQLCTADNAPGSGLWRARGGRAATYPSPNGTHCLPCPRASHIWFHGAGRQCLGSAYGTMCCAAGNCTGQSRCKGRRNEAHSYPAVLQLVSKFTPEPVCKQARFLTCLGPKHRLLVANTTYFKVRAYDDPSSCKDFYPYFTGGYTSTRTAYIRGAGVPVSTASSQVFDTGAYGLVSDAAAGTVTIYLVEKLEDHLVPRLPPRAPANCSATFKLVKGHIFDLVPPNDTQCDPADRAATYGGRRFCLPYLVSRFRNSTTGSCQRCPLGHYNFNMLSASACTPCPAGHRCGFSRESRWRPVPCEAGTHAPEPGMSECILCPANTFTPANGTPAVQCIPCPNGTISREGTSTCSVPWDAEFRLL